MDFTFGALFASLVISSIGAGLAIYGKKQGRPPQLIVGVLMGIYPYFIGNAWVMLGIGACLTTALVAAVRMGY